MKDKAKAIGIHVEMNTKTMAAKLKAIAKHADALAKELEEIDQCCPECGSDMAEATTIYANGVPDYTKVTCLKCGLETMERVSVGKDETNQ